MATGRRLLFLWLLAAGVAGCARHETPVAAGDREQVLYRSLGYEVPSLDPHLAAGIAEQDVASALFEGLVDEDPRDLHPIPGVAESWTVSGDGLSYTFRLRPDARWSDGAPVTAQDFIDGWRRVLTPSLGAENAGMLFALRGAEEFHRGGVPDFSGVGAEAPDAHTLRATLGRPDAGFLSMLSHPAWFPVPLRVIAGAGPPYGRGNPWASPGRLVGNGPFTLQSWSPDEAIVVVKSPTYWDAARVRLAAIRFYPTDSVNAEELAFRAGQLHVTDAIPVDRIDAYRRDNPGFLRVDPYLGTYFYRLNVRRPPLTDPRVRRALSLAIDRRAIVARILRGEQTEALSFTPPGIGGYAPPNGRTADFDDARRLLASAGFPGGRGFPSLELLYNNSENHRAIAEAVQETWRRELGVGVRLANQEEKVVLSDRQTGDYDIVRSAWIADYADAASFLDIFRGNNGNNQTGWSNPSYDALLDAAAASKAPVERDRLRREAEQLLLDEAPILPIYHYNHVYLLRPSVHGWYPTLLDHHPYKFVWLGDSAQGQSPAP
jgi:oligopeptide transport system substrate-binding protein